MKNIFNLIIISLLIACNNDDDSVISNPEIIESSSPWITTALYKQKNGEIDRSINYINDTSISNGTISSAQYKDGKFIFVPVDPNTGDFTSPMTAETHTSNFGNYELYTIDGTLTRRLFNTNFGYTNERKVTQLDSSKFTYLFTPSNDSVMYYVEHEPYHTVFPNKTYPDSLNTLVNERFNSFE